MKSIKSSSMDSWKSLSFGVSMLLIICVIIVTAHGCQPEEKFSPPKSEDVDNAIKLSANYLVKATNEDGKFKYRVNLDPRINVAEKYNMLRHAGSIYSLATYYKTHPDSNLLSAIEKAGRYLQNKSIFPIVTDEDSMLAVWSMPEVTRSNKAPQVKLGGTGLGLIALMSIETISPGFTSLHRLKKIGRSIVYMQKEDGSFYSKYIPSKGGLQDNWQSLYYPGEAALGLLMLYEKDSSDIWFKSAYKTLEYLALSRKNSTDVPADHWALLSTEKILSLENSNELPINRELLINHAIQICETILANQYNEPSIPQFDGGFSKNGNTTPTSTRLEGLIAVLSFLPENHEIRNRIDTSIPRGMSFLIQAQIKDGEFAGAMPRSAARIRGDSPGLAEFNRRATEIRIDYIQHAMSAMMQYQKLMNETKMVVQ